MTLSDPHRRAEVPNACGGCALEHRRSPDQADPVERGLYQRRRSALAAVVVMLLYMRATGRKVRFNRYSVSAALMMTGLMFSFVVSNKLTTAANAIVLEYTSPVSDPGLLGRLS